MERLESTQSSTDCTSDVASPQPQMLSPTSETLTNIEEYRDLQRVYSSQTSNVGQPADESSPMSTPEISGVAIPVPMPQITQSNSQLGETSQVTTAPVEEESSGDIEVLIRVSEETTVSTDSSVKCKTGKRSKKKLKSMQHPIEFATKPEIANELNIPHTSTEFNHHGELIPIHIAQLCDVQKISHGEFGRVFSVVIKGSSDIPIAVKVIPCEKIKVSEITIMQEVCAAEYPYIIDYHCALINPDNLSLCICMEYMDASIDALYKAIHRQANLECDKLEQLVHRITHDVASGLNYMERKEIIHRDIKPANLLINKNAVIKLCDFGISRSFARLNLYFNDLDDADFCSLSPLLHTENYMPPRIKGVIQDDMWSLGITLLEVINGENPFIRWESGGRYFPLMGWEPLIPVIKSHDMQQIILRLLEKDSHDRPLSYDHILTIPCISNVLDPPSIEERDFICAMIENIPQAANSNY